MISNAAGEGLLRPAPHPEAHWARVKAEAAQLLEEVPLYRDAGGRACPLPPSSSSAEAVSAWLGQIPTVRKRDLRRGFPKSLVRRSCDLKAEMARGTVEIIATSGTTDSRLQVIWEWAWWDPQEREAMRSNARIAERMPAGASGFREAVLTTPVCGGSTCHVGNLSRAERTIDGMLFLNQVADPSHWSPSELDRMMAEWNDLQPDGVEADPAYLGLLCRHAAARRVRLHPPAFVTLTYEQATRAQRRAISAVIDSPLYSLYGATECGVLFMECTDGRLHHNTRHSHIELVDAGNGLGRVIVTTLGRTWMPLLRYELGDLVRLAEGPCPCGRDDGGYLLQRVEGRGDERVGGASPAMLDDAIDAADPAISAWQLIGEKAPAAEGEYVLKVVGSDGRAAATAVEQLTGARVTPRSEAALLPEGSGKYRLVKK
jgi:phenylacetate-coenzyme A ligase PaaK-like adenylate-forming protein